MQNKDRNYSGHCGNTGSHDTITGRQFKWKNCTGNGARSTFFGSKTDNRAVITKESGRVFKNLEQSCRNFGEAWKRLEKYITYRRRTMLKRKLKQFLFIWDSFTIVTQFYPEGHFIEIVIGVLFKNKKDSKRPPPV